MADSVHNTIMELLLAWYIQAASTVKNRPSTSWPRERMVTYKIVGI